MPSSATRIRMARYVVIAPEENVRYRCQSSQRLVSRRWETAGMESRYAEILTAASTIRPERGGGGGGHGLAVGQHVSLDRP